RKDYVDNWLSENHERFCDLTGPRWADLLTAAGFALEPGSGAWRNEWLVEHSFAPVAALHDAATGEPVDWPDTHVLTVARRPELGARARPGERAGWPPYARRRAPRRPHAARPAGRDGDGRVPPLDDAPRAGRHAAAHPGRRGRGDVGRAGRDGPGRRAPAV